MLLLLMRLVSAVCFKSQSYMQIKSCLSRTYLRAIVINILNYLHARSRYANGAVRLVYKCPVLGFMELLVLLLLIELY